MNKRAIIGILLCMAGLFVLPGCKEVEDTNQASTETQQAPPAQQ